MIKSLRNLMLVLPALFISGCTALLWHVNDAKEYSSRRSLEYSDVIYSAFEYKNTTLSVSGKTKTPQAIDLPLFGVGFIGKKNVYFVTQNGDELLSLNDLMKTAPLRMVGNEKYIDIDITEDKYASANATFRQSLSIRTLQPVAELTLAQKDALVKQGFSAGKDYYQKTFWIEGFIINRQRLNGDFPATAALNERYPVRFYTHKLVKSFDGGKLTSNILLTPVTLVGDILLIPFYLVSAING